MIFSYTSDGNNPPHTSFTTYPLLPTITMTQEDIGMTKRQIKIINNSIQRLILIPKQREESNDGQNEMY